MNTLGQLESISFAYGATVVRHNVSSFMMPTAMTLGSYINGDNSIRADKNNRLFQHEYGHYLQSQTYGFMFLSVFGIPSLISAMTSDDHDRNYAEQDANVRSWFFFNQNTGGIDWKFGSNPIGYSFRTLDWKSDADREFALKQLISIYTIFKSYF